MLTAAAVAQGGGAAWSPQSDDALRAQGAASAQGVSAFTRFGLPHLGDLGERLGRPGARLLDVGTGVGAPAVAYAREFPHLHVLGIDVLDRALDLARRTIAEAGGDIAARVAVRRLDVVDLVDPDGFDLVWLPVPFVPETAVGPGLARIAAALRPGGWILVGHGRFGENPVDDALTTFQTVAHGGTPLDGPAARRLLADAGLAAAQTMPTPPGGPGVTVARRPG